MTVRDHQIKTAQPGALYVVPNADYLAPTIARAKALGRDDITVVVLKGLHPEIARKYPEVVFDHGCTLEPTDDMSEFLRRIV